jgi:hypothetical protein
MESIKEDKAKEEYLTVWDNSDAFRNWLSSNDIEFIPNGHSTLVPFSCDIFQLGGNFALYKQNHPDNISKSPGFEAGKQEERKTILEALRKELTRCEGALIPPWLDGFESAIYLIDPIKLDDKTAEDLKKAIENLSKMKEKEKTYCSICRERTGSITFENTSFYHCSKCLIKKEFKMSKEPKPKGSDKYYFKKVYDGYLNEKGFDFEVYTKLVSLEAKIEVLGALESQIGDYKGHITSWIEAYQSEYSELLNEHNL